MSEQVAFNIDCMEYMKTIPDKYFDLAVVDPPYGGGAKANAEDVFKGGIVGGRSKKYAEIHSQSVNVERERD